MTTPTPTRTRTSSLKTRLTPRAASPDRFYGWHIVAYSAITLAATAPGQTAAVSAFIDPMMRDLGVSRGQISTAYLLGTLTGAAAMSFVGRAIDRYGTRRSMLAIGAAFGAVLLSLALVQGLTGLTLGFVGIRLLGQGALGLTATTAAARWFIRRRGSALGIVSAAGAAGISTAPLFLERLISAHGWRAAWVVEGLLIWAIVIPLAVFAMKDDPAHLGQRPDGAAGEGHDADREARGATRREAFGTPFFWVLTAGVAVSGLLSTAIAFHQISLLGERGLSTAEAAANFIPQTVAGLVATLATGHLVDRISSRWLTAASMLLLTGALGWAVVVNPGWSAIGFGVALGASGSSIRALESASVPRYFGTRHLGSIRGFVASVSVGSTAFGPVLFATGFQATGSYSTVLLGSATLPLAVVVAALVVKPPRAQDHVADESDGSTLTSR
ncbi:MAG: MFS transporter [Actinomycetota bacterium]